MKKKVAEVLSLVKELKGLRFALIVLLASSSGLFEQLLCDDVWGKSHPLFWAITMLVVGMLAIAFFRMTDRKEAEKQKRKEALELRAHSRAVEIIGAMRETKDLELSQAVKTLDGVGINIDCFLYFPFSFPEEIWAPHVEVSPDDFARCLYTLIAKYEADHTNHRGEFLRRIYIFLTEHHAHSLAIRVSACLGARMGVKTRDTIFGS